MRLPDKRVVRKYSQKDLIPLAQGSVVEALKATQPLLSQKIPFRLLDHTGQITGKASETQLSNLFRHYFEVKDIRIVKGIGWGLKTLGKYYPDLVSTFLRAQKGRKPSRLLIKKTITYLPLEYRRE